jgi:predicted transcriptional regulator
MKQDKHITAEDIFIPEIRLRILWILYIKGAQSLDQIAEEIGKKSGEVAEHIEFFLATGIIEEERGEVYRLKIEDHKGLAIKNFFEAWRERNRQ